MHSDGREGGLAHRLTPHRPSRRAWAIIAASAALIVALIVALVMWLPVTPADPPAAAPTSSPPVTPEPEPSEAPNAPQALVQLACDDLVSPADVAAVLAVGVAAQSSSPVRDGRDALLRQAGMSRCEWSAGDRELTAIVALDPELFDFAQQDARESTVDGHRVSELCSISEDAVCRLDLASGDVYVSLALRGTDVAELQAALRGLVPSIARAVTAAPVSTSEWTPPQTSLTSDAVRSVDPGVLGAAFGLVGARVWGGEAGAITFRALTTTDSAEFRIGDDTRRHLDLLVVAGGAWAVDELLGSGYTSINVDGVDQAAIAPALDPLSGGLVACMDVDRSLVCVTTDETDAVRLAAELATFARALLA
ncbi:MAG: hypothetical protein QM598_07375 [Protaetiibacter sp.]